MMIFKHLGLVLGLFGLFALQQLGAQTSIGFRVGFSANNVVREPLENNEPTPQIRPGVQLGIPIEIRLSKWFSVQPELLFATHGAFQDRETSDALTTTRFYRSFYMSALEVPVLAKFTIGSGNVRLSAFAGPSVGMGLGGKLYTKTFVSIKDFFGTVIFAETLESTQQLAFLSNGYDNSELENNDFAVERLNFNLHLGAGIQVKTGPVSLFLDGRLMLGLNDLDPESSTETTNSTLQSVRGGLNVGVLLPVQ
ncbi:MAG: PorT family protein [Saprospiraceae bacterium]|nr:PorT family protein [Saprospiraceae bacterium]